MEPWLISWLAAYLTGRRQRVKCGNITSEWADVEAGVIQGSVLGPILFILFISDINEFIPAGVEIEKYADDILAYITFKSASDLGTIPQQIADGVEKWCAINKMRLNPSKCKVLLVNPSSQPDTALSLSLSLPTLSGLPVEVVSSYKYLGVILTGELNWDCQWDRVQSIIASVPFLLKRLKQLGFNQRILVNVYRSYALSHFTYSAPLLTSVSSTAKDEMASFQRRMLRIIGINAATALLTYKLSTIDELIESVCVKMLKKIIADPTHPITINLPRSMCLKETRGNAVFLFMTYKANTTAYQ